MSLIADALKAAQKERERSRGVRAHRARRVLEGGSGQRTLAVRASSFAVRITRPVAVALGLFIVAFGTLIWVFFSAPEPATAGPNAGPRSVAAAGGASGGPESAPVVTTVEEGADERGGSRDAAAAQPEEPEAPPAAEGPASGSSDVDGPEARTGTTDPGTPPADEPTTDAGAEDPAVTGSDAGTADEALLGVPVARPDPPARPERTARNGTRPEAERRADGPSFQLSVEAPAGAPELFGLALAAQRRGDFDRARALYEEAVADEPGNARLHNNLGTVYRSLGRLEEAKEAYRRALVLDDGFAAAWNNLGVVYEALGEAAEAVVAYERALRLEPDNRSAMINLANQYRVDGRHGEALGLLQEVLVLDPASAEAHYAIARVYEANRDRTAAARHYRSFLEHAAGRFPDLEAAVRRHLTTLEG